MQLEGVDVAKVSKLISRNVDSATCLTCCKYFIAPERAPCGHVLCHTCWLGRRSCPACKAPVQRRLLKLDSHMQLVTNHARELVEAFEELFDISLDKFVMDIPVIEKENDPRKNVNDWLASSDNHFSAPPLSETQQSTQDILPPIKLSTSKVQIHAEASLSLSPKKVIPVAVPQDDWDKIEAVPDTEDIPQRNKENVIGPMDFEPFPYDDNEFSNEQPRRSTRNKMKTDTSRGKSPVQSEIAAKPSNTSNLETEKKLDKSKHSWVNVKKMKKEFSKLNKQNKNKLNISIEMCNKNQSLVSKQRSKSPQTTTIEAMVIDDDTPNITKNKRINEQNIEEKTSTSDNKSSFYENANPANNKMTEDLIITDDDKVIINKSTQKSNFKQKSQNENKQDCVELMTKKDEGNVSISQINKGATINIPFIKKSTFQPTYEETQNSDDDIHISIRIKEVVTNITISKKTKEVQLKVNTDRVVQTSLEPTSIPETHIQTLNTKTVEVQTDPRTACVVQTSLLPTNISETHYQPLNTKTVEVQTDPHNDSNTVSQKYAVTKQPAAVLDNTTPSRKNTASAATATAQLLITESVEKELSDVMEREEEMSKIEKVSESPKTQALLKTNTINKIHDSNNDKAKTTDKDTRDDLNLDDIDIFNSGSVKEHNVQMLKCSSKTPSEILVPTHKSSKSKTQKLAEKRSRKIDDIAESTSKRHKTQTLEKSIINDNIDNEVVLSVQEQNKTSDSTDYNDLMGQVFANIDADIEESQKLQITGKKSSSNTITETFNKIKGNTQREQEKTQTVVVEKYSENMFSTVGNMLEKGNPHVPGTETQQNIANLLTPGMCSELAGPDMLNEAVPRIDTQRQCNEEIVVLCTPVDEDDSDKGVVEATPQKNISIPKKRNDPGNSKVSNIKKLQLLKPKVHETKTMTVSDKGKSLDTQDSCNIINLSDSEREPTSKKDSAIEKPTSHKQSLETPLTINRFVESIRHNSTPVAKKSLNFTKNDDINPDDEEDITLCPLENTLIAKTTQDKQFMKEAFERPLVAKTVVEEATKKFRIAGSCLSSAQLTNVKVLCLKRKWTYVDKYTPDLTHLVVAVDDENKSQRSVKYMCALAAGKWIISYGWVEKCLETNTAVHEEPYEVLDSTGEPGPRRSRLTDSKIFVGFTFCCMPPFSMLDLNTLVSMLQAAGARVVEEPCEVKVTSSEPCVLLCEPEHTQEDRYMYLAMQLGVVPVNYEWALNCLGGYTLCSLYDLLLCPAALLPKQVQNWPPELTQRSDDTE